MNRDETWREWPEGYVCGWNTTAAKGHYPLVRNAPKGAWLRTANEHWRGPRDPPLGENRRLANRAVVVETIRGGRHERGQQAGKRAGQEEGRRDIGFRGRKVGGIDVGSKAHWVYAPARGGEGREVEVFGAITRELERMASWLLERGVESVALESTGVYWIPVHEVLEGQGLEVLLVDTRAVARVPGRTKSDRRDCEWIQRLHSCGLLRGAFRPPEQICMLRTLVRDKAILVAEQGDWVRRM